MKARYASQLSLRLSALCALLLLGANALAELPNPMRLSDALAIAHSHDAHPALRAARAQFALEQTKKSANADLALAIVGVQGHDEPPPDGSQLEEQAHLEAVLLNARQMLWIAIAGAYFDVLVADANFRVRDEEMANAFVMLNRTRERHEAQRINDVELLKAENDYAQARALRYEAAASQRTTRSALKTAMAHTGQLPGELLEPNLKSRTLDTDIDTLTRNVRTHHPELVGLGHAVRRAHKHAAVTRAHENADAGRAPANDATSAQNLPDTAALSSHLQAWLVRHDDANTHAVARAEAMLSAATIRIEHNLIATVASIDAENANADAAQALAQYRELSLDLSRALYEQAKPSAIGAAMVNTTVANLRLSESRYRSAIAHARIDAMLGLSPKQMTENTIEVP